MNRRGRRDFVFIAAGRLPDDGASRNGPFHGAPDLAVEEIFPLVLRVAVVL